MIVTMKKLSDPSFLKEILRKAGLEMNEEVEVIVKPKRVEILNNPLQALWGTLRSRRKVEDVRLEAYEDLGGYLNAKEPE